MLRAEPFHQTRQAEPKHVCTMTKARLVPCSFAAPPSIPSTSPTCIVKSRACFNSSSTHLLCALCCSAPPASLPASCLCYPRPCASSPMLCLSGWRGLQRKQLAAFVEQLFSSTNHALDHKHCDERVLVRRKFPNSPWLRVSTLAPYSPPLTVLTACCRMLSCPQRMHSIACLCPKERACLARLRLQRSNSSCL
jgi:hypothetical protein